MNYGFRMSWSYPDWRISAWLDMVILITVYCLCLLRDGTHRRHYFIFRLWDDHIWWLSCLLHLPIIWRLLYHSIINGPEALDLMVTYLRVNSGDGLQEIDNTRGFHARKIMLTTIMQLWMLQVMMHGLHIIEYEHWGHTTWFSSAQPFLWIKVDIVYIKYFIDLEMIHEYN